MGKMENQKWYFRTSVLVIAILSVGPLALPLLWFNPRYGVLSKIIWTALILVGTYYSVKILDQSIRSILDYYRLAMSGGA